MTTQDRAAFLAERKLGIGGSDVAALYSLDYSCRRKLFYDKSNAVPNFPSQETLAMELGQYMEEFFARRYEKLTGRSVMKLTEPLVSSPPLRVNVDRLIDKDGKQVFFLADKIPMGRDYGVLEIKSMGREMFYRTKREGLSRSYILQLQSGMIAANASWGSFAIGSRDSGELIHFDVERDEALCKAIPEDAARFWELVEYAERDRFEALDLDNEDDVAAARAASGIWRLDHPIPTALEPDDRRCQKCEFRVTCQGNALVQLEPEGELVPAPDLAGLVAEKIERDALYDQAVELCGETDSELKTKLGDRQAVIVGDRALYHRPQKGKTLYRGKELLRAYIRARGELAAKIRSSIDDFYIEPQQVEGKAEDSLIGMGIDAPSSFLSESKPSRPLRLMPPKGGK